MKKIHLLVAALITIGSVSSSFAAQDQTLIQETRKNQLAHDAKGLSALSTQTDSVVRKQVLPLDHGPRAIATPWEKSTTKIIDAGAN